jgi:glycosyltransferase involved in cell wall biosynthesis
VGGSPFGYELLPSLKRAFPPLRTVDILHNASAAGHIARSVMFTDAIDRHIAVTGDIARELGARGIASAKRTVIPNGVDVEAFDPARYRRADALRQLGLAADRPVIAFIGRLNEEKQPLQFLALAARLADTRAQFVLVGDGLQHQAVADRLKQGDVRHRVSWLKNVPPERSPGVLAAADALVITSTIEGLPIVMLEALAMGAPVFTYDVGDVRAAITTGHNGYVVEPGNLNALTAALRRFVNDPAERQTLQAAARPSLLRGGFTLAAQQQAYAAVLLGLPSTLEPELAAV